VTESGEFIVNAQAVAVPKLAHAPPQPAKVEGDVVVSVKVTVVPFVYVAEQVPDCLPLAVLQLIAEVLSTTVPVPVPTVMTVSNSAVGVTVREWVLSLLLAKPAAAL